MIFTALLLLISSGDGARCVRPAAPTAAEARRLAQIMIVNRNRTGRPLPPYDLQIVRDPEDAGQWLARQIPRDAGDQEMSFRIDRCTGQISRITYAR